ncbi:MAG: metal ABC transporter permease [Gammaproteobacteria bacterium]|nr:metal ABC transporter permease [Gammaproteobacteria bacterium]
MDDFVFRALLAGLAVAVLTGPLGCLVVWRRMAYFGDTLAHSALLGVALSLLWQLHPALGVALLGVVIAISLVWLQRHRDLATDTMLGILAHTSLGLGLVVIAILQSRGLNIDLNAYLFGDILALSQNEVWFILASVVVLIPLISGIWKPMVAIAVHEDLARVEGVQVVKIRLIFMILMAVVVAVAMKITGILLITALLIIPAAAARKFSHSPEQMAVLAILLGMLAVIMGLFSSLQWDTPTGPSMVVAAALLFFVSRIRKTT